MSEYIRANPLSNLVDFEDEEYSDVVIKNFVISNNDNRTVVLIQCDSRIIEE